MSKHVHILGIGGTFMGSLATIAKQLNYQVTGMDKNIYPPMSEQLIAQNIHYTEGYHPQDLPQADTFIIGNALSRGNACVEEVLSKQYHYTSGAQWIAQTILKDKWVLAVSGTHGKTTTASMLTWILDYAGLNPSFLIGGVSQNFERSARLTNSPFFVIEADEYDTAFFDKRSKFIHYQPKTLIINNLEFDHGDIFNSLDDIQKQFHYLIRTVPNDGLIIYPKGQSTIEQVLDMGMWSRTQALQLPIMTTTDSGCSFAVDKHNTLAWGLLGEHNMANALCAIHAAYDVGVSVDTACKALQKFKGVKRRMEVRYQDKSITIYDDFAHHPSAIYATLSGLRAKVKNAPIIAIVELRSNTMKMGVHQQTLLASFKPANQILLLKPKNINWDIAELVKKNDSIVLFNSVNEIIDRATEIAKGHFVIMSNGGFDNIHSKLVTRLSKLD